MAVDNRDIRSHRRFKASRKAVLNVIGTGPAKRLRKYQELESRVLMKDLLDHGDTSVGLPVPSERHGEVEVPEKHWFALVRRFVS